MHVLIIPSWFDPRAPYRVSPFIFEQALALRRSNINVGVLYVGYSGRGVSYTRSEFDGVSIVSVTLPRLLRRTRQFSLALLSGLHKILYHIYCRHYGKPTVLHAHSMYAGGICTARLARSHNRPFVITEHFSGFSLGMIKNWQIKAIRNAAASSSRILFVSETLRQDFGLFIPTENGKILPNNYSGLLNKNINTLAVANVRKYFCIVARLDANKNVAMCLRAFAMLSTSENDLHIVGSGVEQSRLEQLAQELKITERVVFHGSQSREDTFAMIKGASALIVCSVYETFGMTVLEAAMLGTPVIATRCGGPEEILGESFGVLVDKGDDVGLAKAMHEALVNRSKFRCNEALRLVSSTYGPTEIAAQLRSEYYNAMFEYQK